jgi:Flp pilus assembly protein CpaB
MEPSETASAFQIPRGMRPVSVHLAENVSVVPRDHVDVLLTTKQGHTSTVVKDVEVAAVDQTTRVVTVLICPSDALKLTTAAEHSKIRLLKVRGML